MSDIQTITVQAGGTVNIYFGCNFVGSGSPKRIRKENAASSPEPEEDQVIEEEEEGEEEVYRREEPSERLKEAKAHILACEDNLSVNVRTVFANLAEEHVAEILAASSEDLDEVLEGLFPDAD